MNPFTNTDELLDAPPALDDLDDLDEVEDFDDEEHDDDHDHEDDPCECYIEGLHDGWNDAFRFLNPNATEAEHAQSFDAFMASLDGDDEEQQS